VRFVGPKSQAIRNQFLEHAPEHPDEALLARLDIALRQTANSADKARAAWAIPDTYSGLGLMRDQK
jgi:hypothetical protein